MRDGKFLNNDNDGWLTEADECFRAAEQAARAFEEQHAHSTALLHSALFQLYELGEALRAQPNEPGRSLIEEFIVSRGASWNLPTRRNPYIALTNLAFRQSASSRSQYAAVLAFASDSRVKPAHLTVWLQEGGVKGRYAQAVAHFSTPRKQRISQERASRLDAAKQSLLERKHSKAVALPDGVRADEGFVTLIAKVSEGKAAIIDVLDAGEELDPILLRYAPPKASGKSALAENSMFRLYRAIDLVHGSTPDEPDSSPRDILLINSYDREQPVCRVEAVSEAYTYAWAGMRLSDHLDGLPPHIPFILNADDAVFFKREFENHDDWSVGGDLPRINAEGLSTPIVLNALLEPAAYRVGQPASGTEKRVSAAHEHQQFVLQFLAGRRADHDRQKAKGKEKLNFPSEFNLRLEAGELKLQWPVAESLMTSLGSSSPDRDLSERTLVIKDVERLLRAITPYETTLDGTFVDIEVEDAALCLQAHFDADVFTVVLPTKAGTDYNQSCSDLVI